MAPSAAPSSSSHLLLASPHSPPTLLRLCRAGGRSLGLSRRGGSARLRVVRRAVEEDESGAASGGQEEEAAPEESVAGRDLVTLTACLVGLLTGVSVVLFNLSVHEIRDIFWDSIPLRGASWLREEPIDEVWQRVIFVPVSGGVIVGGLNALRSYIKTNSNAPVSKIKSAFRPFLKAVAASFTLGTGNSLGPEGPSVEIGSAIAKGFGNVFEWEGGKRLSLVAAGSAAGISSGFNAAVAGCFFAVESVLWPSADSSSLANSTPMVILSSVIASVVSEIGLGSDPAFTVPEYDFRSPTATGMAYGKFMRFTFTGPEPLLHVPFLDVASPQAYGLVGMAATLAGVCKVPLTSVLLLFELTQDYRIVLPLLGAVGLSSWIASPQRFSKRSKLDSQEDKSSIPQQANNMLTENKQATSMDTDDSPLELCKIESSLCVYDANDDNMFKNLTVAEAMKTNYFSVSMTTPLIEALDLMLAEKQPFVMITENNTFVRGLLALKNIQDFCRAAKTTRAHAEVKELLISHVCQAGKCKSWSVTPQMPLTTAEKIMDSHGVDHLPVVSEDANPQDRGPLIGFVDRECIAIARRAMATKEIFSSMYEIKKEER
ncbi:chloride channel protein CLC-e-like isoform X2 [Miscanthus floridulus]|uniref:chloride channel protein CLC-e-like isoform X2 n=1 Tax=Miscanthus floridulus TaxID=154761 RepID=UPI00345AB24C